MSEAPRLSWHAVRDRIQGQILNRTYGPGDRLPRDEDIAASLGCARATVQRAMQDLVQAGLIERRRKGGTHVCADPVTRATLDIPITRREVESRGQVYSHRLLQRETALPPAAVRARLRAGAVPMLRVRALHLADGAPYILEDRWICLETAPEIAGVDLERVSANEWLVRNKPYDACDVVLSAHAADDATAHAMETPPGAALLGIERTTWIAGRPITTVQALCAPGYRLRSTG